MAAAWQLWMPLYIQRLKSNPFVIAMHPSARAGYIWLVTEQWQTDDCTLPNDIKTLKVMSGLGTYWDEQKEEILERFNAEGDRLRNTLCYELWMEAKARYEEGQMQYEALRGLRSKASKAGNDKRWKDHRKVVPSGSQTDPKRIPKPSAVDPKYIPNDRLTDTYTHTNTKEETLLASHPSGNSAETPFVELPTNRRNLHFPVYESHILDWIALYPAVDARQQVRNMRGWLDGNPEHRKTLKGTPAFIHRWLSRAQDKGGSVGTQPSSNGSRGLVSPASQRVESGVNAFRQAGERLGITATRGVDGADGSPLSPSGHRAGSGELPVRHAALTGEARVQGSGDGTPDFAHKAQPEILPPPDRSGTGVRGYGS